MKNVFLIFLLILCSYSFYGQTLVRFGNQTIPRNEFLAAFRKNNSMVRATDSAYRDYLNLYIRYKLKVQAAYDERLDTMAGQITELQNFKSQIVDQYMQDEASINEMAKEAFTRSQHDLRISCIFVAASKNSSPADTLKAWKKVNAAYSALKNRRDFGEVALQYSEDPFVKENRGDLGYITVFDLPYSIETVAYRTPVTKFSPVFRTGGGYIILKKTAERRAEGRIRIAQILLIFPFNATNADKMNTRLRADSIYQALKSGADFGALARKFSGDNLSYQLDGVLPEFGIGKYEAGFERAAFNLKKDGEISPVYESSFGFHIIKRIARKPVPAVADKKTLEDLKEKIKADPRVAISRQRMLQTIMKQTGFREYIPSGNRLWDYTDSLLQDKKPAPDAGFTSQSVLFEFPDKKYLVGDWIAYRKTLKSAPNVTNGKTHSEILDLFRQAVAFEYYRAHLEKYNTLFSQQVTDFREGNLLFEIMQRRVWNRASADSTGLRKYFDLNAKNYWWKPSAEAIIFSAPNITSAKNLQSRLQGNISDWRKIVDSLTGQVQADSGRFEFKQIPSFNQDAGRSKTVESESFTALQANADKSTQFAYIIRKYASPSPRTFDEARGLVITDYQNELENQWIEELKGKYPVTINQNVFKTLPK